MLPEQLPAVFSWMKLCLAATLFITSIAATAGETSPLVVTMTPEVRMIEHRGKDEVVRYLRANQVEQGEEIYYTVRITNPGKEKVRHAVVVQPVPANTRLVEKSVTGAGASLSYSVDGGKSFVGLAELRSATGPSTKVTHIRWQFRHPLAPHVTVLARFRVIFE